MQMLITLGGLSCLASILGLEDPDLVRMVFWTLVAGFFFSSIWVSFRIILRFPKHFGFVYILLLMTSVSWVAYGFTTIDLPIISNIDSIFLTYSQNLLGLVVLIVVVDLMTRSLIRKNEVGWAITLAARTNIMSRMAVTLVVIIYAIITLYRFSLGLVMSGTGGVMATVSTLQSILLQVSSSVGGVIGVLGFLFLFTPYSKRQKVGVVLVVVQSILAFLGGRRGLMALYLLGSMFWILLRGINTRRLLVTCALMAMIFLVAGPFFFLLRSTAQNLGIHEIDAALRGGVLAQSFSTVVDEFSLTDALQPSYIENIKNRAGFFDWTVTLQERVTRGWATRDGEIALISIIETIPRVFFPGKLQYLRGEQVEQKIQQWFALPMQDSASTILGYAIADGGWVGVFIYFAAFGVLLAVLFQFMLKANFVLSSLWAASALFFLCFNIEMDLAGLIGTLRMLIIVSILDQMVKKLFWKKGKVMIVREKRGVPYLQREY